MGVLPRKHYFYKEFACFFPMNPSKQDEISEVFSMCTHSPCLKLTTRKASVSFTLEEVALE